ncbi:uncharacterized protein ASPGLDRAFT_51526 [Aspergillus glaucus CBS 516.65]|uniref:Uncharacterized protein n=1 Tax=Aspergillus glaucus CBS 516.65 TaxID=1160497 RepID=A0A1L9V8W9_ASPGL|nr:hypothetical protein ASPGLDRAFT_51526 [Aspergillus glaucus CBS 516.65]OJJ80315.1 hypothetical protein ASPGLDRAFT_51526 [Aspergillus glaucus CBS 516.65]
MTYDDPTKEPAAYLEHAQEILQTIAAAAPISLDLVSMELGLEEGSTVTVPV